MLPKTASKKTVILTCDTAFGLHPATWLFICCLSLLVLPWLTPHVQMISLAVMLPLLLYFKVTQFIRLCYKSRFLLAMTLILFSWQTPGKTVIPAQTRLLTKMLPTQEGLQLALQHAISLILLIAIVSFCLNLLNKNQLAIGIYRLTSWIPKLNAKRFSIQFLLCLEYLVHLPAITITNFASLFDMQPETMTAFPSTFILTEPPFAWVDKLILLSALVLPLLLWQII